MAATRNIKPTVANRRATLGTLVRDGRDEEAEQVRRELAEAKFWSDIERAVDTYQAKNGPLTGSQVEMAIKQVVDAAPALTDEARALLGGA